MIITGILVIVMTVINGIFVTHGKLTDEDAIESLVRFSNSLVPPLFQAYSGNNSNLVFSPFGLSTNIAIIMDCIPGKPLGEITKLFHLQEKQKRQLLRKGFKIMLEQLQETSANKEELAGSYNKGHLISGKALPTSLIDHLTKTYFIDISSNNTLVKNNSTGQVLDIRSDTGIMSHWKDYHKLAVYTYLSYIPSAPFHLKNQNETINVPMIPLVGTYRAGRIPNLACEGAELLFENKEVSLLLLMPDENNTLEQLQEKLFQDNFFQILESLPRQETQIFLPQLSAITNNLQLSSFLQSLGIISIFDETAITGDKQKNNIYVRSIKQNAFFSTSFIALNSVASISTKIQNKKEGSRRKKRDIITKITFNKPFLFFVLHHETRLILLAGQIKIPTQVPN